MEDSRMIKANQILLKGEFKKIDDSTYEVRGHKVSVSSCDCMDFRTRQAICKHILAVQLLKQESLIGVNYEKIQDALLFSKRYGEGLLNTLKSTHEVIEERNKLIWFT